MSLRITMRTGHLLLIFILYFPVAAAAQSNYIITDTTTVYGVRLIDRGDIENSQYIELRVGGDVIRYTPDQVKEYGFRNGRVYISKKIETPEGFQSVFLERLIQGTLTLYYYPKTDETNFYLERDSSLTHLYSGHTGDGQPPFRESLRNLTSDCSNVADAVNLVRYTKRSLSLFISRYNTCDPRPFPFFKYGIVSGIHSSSLALISSLESLNQSLKDSNFIKDRSFSVGIFVDIPLFVSDYSLYSGINYYENSYYSSSGTTNNFSEITVNLSTIEVPLLVRYAYPTTRFRPFYNAGLSYLINIKNQSTIYESTINNNVVEFDIIDSNQIVSNHQLGIIAGIGSMVHLSYDQVVFLELRLKAHYNLTKEYLFEKDGFRKNNLFQRSGIELVAGFNL